MGRGAKVEGGEMQWAGVPYVPVIPNLCPNKTFSPGMTSTLINVHYTPVVNLQSPNLNVHINFIIRHYIIYHFHYHQVCDKKCATMDHEGPSMSVIIYIDHQLTLPLMFISIPGVERRRSTQVV